VCDWTITVLICSWVALYDRLVTMFPHYFCCYRFLINISEAMIESMVVQICQCALWKVQLSGRDAPIV